MSGLLLVHDHIVEISRALPYFKKSGENSLEKYNIPLQSVQSIGL